MALARWTCFVNVSLWISILIVLCGVNCLGIAEFGHAPVLSFGVERCCVHIVIVKCTITSFLGKNGRVVLGTRGNFVRH